LKFKVFQDGKTVDGFDVSGAYLFGTDGIPVRKAQIGFVDGCIDCNQPKPDTVGLVLLWPVEGFGRILLPTTCLPEREEPYCLNVELARGKLMQIINKFEDSSLFAKDGPGKEFDDARQSFIDALNAISDMGAASQFADKALEKATVFADKLATRQAEMMLKSRIKNRGFGKGCLGVVIDPNRIEREEYFKRLCEVFNYITIPVSWAKIESVKGKYDFAELDKCVAALGKKRLAIGAGPLLRFSESSVPQWLLTQKPSFEKIRESAYRFISATVSRYANRIRTWSVVGGLNCHNYFGFSFDQVIELTRAANLAVKGVDARIRKVIEVESPWGQYYSTSPGTIPPLIYMDMVVQGQVSFDTFALKLDSSGGDVGIHSRDMMQISSMLDFLVPIAKPFIIQNIAVPIGSPDGKGQSTAAEQARWLERFYKIVLSKPSVESVVYSSLADTPDDHTGLLTKDFEPKETFRSIKKVRKAILGT
jgi:hypothetical protein